MLYQPGIFERGARSRGKSERTRARLMDAAVEVVAARGVDAASAHEIAQTADVANGTFYNYFTDKDEIVSEVTFRLLREVVLRIDDAMASLDDAAERVTFATRQIIELAASHEPWGRALLRAIPSMYDLRHAATAYARADLERGVADGTFRVDVDDFLLDIFLAMVVAALTRRLAGESGPEAGPRVAEQQLRMLGVPPARARRLAWRDLPVLVLGPPEPSDGASPVARPA